MRITMDVPDDLWADYQKAAGAKDQASVKKRIKALLLEMAPHVKDPNNRWFVVGGDDRRALEKIVGTTIEDATQLVRDTEGLSRFGIGDVVRPLTRGESIHLEGQATFWGQTPAEFIQSTVDRVLDETLNRI